MKRKGKAKAALEQATEEANLRHDLAGVRMRSSDLPPEKKKRQITSARAFLDALFEARALADAGDAGSIGGVGGSFGRQLESARILVGRQHSLDGEMQIHDDSRLAAAARSGGPASLNSFSGTLEKIWSSLEPVERRILTLGRDVDYDTIAAMLDEEGVRTEKGGTPTKSFVNGVTTRANKKIEKQLAEVARVAKALADAEKRDAERRAEILAEFEPAGGELGRHLDDLSIFGRVRP